MKRAVFQRKVYFSTTQTTARLLALVLFLSDAAFFSFFSSTAGLRADETTSGPVDAPASVWRLREREEIADVWNGVSVGFDFLVRSDAVYVAFYNADRSAVVAKQSRGANGWETKILPTKIGWDSHNYLTFAFDSTDRLHVSGNMHAAPLVYFRASEPNDVASLERVGAMTDERENRVTYPEFLCDKEGRLVFTYRDGGSGDGDQIWNVYDASTRAWSRLLDRPLFDGEGARNAYFVGPKLAADGAFHVAWVWRETPDCATNHDLSYARSLDLRNWENSNGDPLETPIRLATGEIVDPIPVGGGLLNSLVRLSFDAESRPILTYSKRDADGKLQIWNARREKNDWNRVPATVWDLVWDFSGGGSVANVLNFSGVSVRADGNLALTWSRADVDKNGTIVLDPTTLRPIEAPASAASTPNVPDYSPEDAREIRRVESDDSRLKPRSATLEVDGERWIFRWETPVANRDKPLPDGAPAPTKLRVLKFEKR